MRGEESKLSENNQGIEKVKQQHYIQEDKVCLICYHCTCIKIMSVHLTPLNFNIQ